MIIPRRFRKSPHWQRNRCLSIVVFPDQDSVFQAYRLLYHHGISLEHLAIVGNGFNSPERVGLKNPLLIIVRKALTYAIAACAVGSLLVLIAVFGWHLEQDLWVVLPTVTLLSGLVGALLGALMGLLGEGTTANVYRHHLRHGRYLLMMEGSEELIRLGQDVLEYYSVLSLY